jgi:hypothetical protein
MNLILSVAHRWHCIFNAGRVLNLPLRGAVCHTHPVHPVPVVRSHLFLYPRLIHQLGSAFQIKKLDVMMQRNGMDPIPLFIKFCLRYLSHLAIAIISVFCLLSQIEQSRQYTWWASALGWIVSLLPLAWSLKFYRRYTNINTQDIDSSTRHYPVPWNYH